MGKIRLIEGYTKIAAGEVIERPASVIKELIENSLDAGATKIFITLEDAGKRLIQLIDDGDGIGEEDVEVAFERHTSSKIQSADELDNLHTLGFRGEALASIAAVSQIELITRPAAQGYAIRLTLNEGKIDVKEQCGGPSGTTLKVKNLFFNLPVRQKFMKNNKVELGHITDIICRYALAYPMVHFKHEHQGLTLINSPAWVAPKKASPQTLKIPATSAKTGVIGESLPLEAYGHAIQTIYGKKLSDAMFLVELREPDIHVYGFLGLPEIARAEKNAASLFVNRRLVNHGGISKIIEICMGDFLMRNKYPFFVLFVDVPPDTVDFNIHPSKKLVRFVDEAEFLARLQTRLERVVRERLKTRVASDISIHSGSGNGNTSTPALLDYWTPASGSTEEEEKVIESCTLPTLSTAMDVGRPDMAKPLHTEKYSAPRGNRGDISREVGAGAAPRGNPRKGTNPTYLRPVSTPSLDRVLENFSIPVKTLPPMTILNSGMQAGQTYLVFQNEKGLIILDQHAADERIHYERVQQMFAENKLQVQNMLVPVKMDVPPNEVEFVKAAIEDLKEFGFNIDHFGGNTFLVRAVPAFVQQTDHPSLIVDLCLEIVRMGREQSFSAIKKEIIQYIACHQSVRAGDTISDSDRLRRLILDLDKCENPRHCAHGRPTYIEITYDELEKLFHRK